MLRRPRGTRHTPARDWPWEAGSAVRRTGSVLAEHSIELRLGSPPHSRSVPLGALDILEARIIYHIVARRTEQGAMYNITRCVSTTHVPYGWASSARCTPMCDDPTSAPSAALDAPRVIGSVASRTGSRKRHAACAHDKHRNGRRKSIPHNAHVGYSSCGQCVAVPCGACPRAPAHRPHRPAAGSCHRAGGGPIAGLQHSAQVADPNLHHPPGPGARTPPRHLLVSAHAAAHTP